MNILTYIIKNNNTQLTDTINNTNSISLRNNNILQNNNNIHNNKINKSKTLKEIITPNVNKKSTFSSNIKKK